MDTGAAEEEDSGVLLPVSVAVPVAVDVGADALDEVTVGIAETDDVVRGMIVDGAAVDEEAEVVTDGDAVPELAADEDVVAVAVADEVPRTMVAGDAVPVLADELTVAELDAVPVTVAVPLAEVVASVRVAELLVAVVVTALLVVVAAPVAVADEEMPV